MGCPLKGNSGLWSRLSVGAVLLAAGRDALIGGRPKALLELGGVPLVLRQLIALSGAGVDELAVVLDAQGDGVEAVVQAFPIHVVRAPAGDAGGAVRLGIAALNPRLDALIVAGADQPLIDAADVTALIGAYKKRGSDAAMVAPRCADGVAGNPLIIDATLRDAWLAGDADPLDAGWRDAHAAAVRWLDVDHRRYHTTIAGDADLDAFAAATGHRLLWPARPAEQPA